MRTITYRTYRGGDEVHIVSLWNLCLTHDPINAQRFRNLVLLDVNFDPEGLRIACDGERIVGVLYALRRLMPMHGTDLEPDNGWVTFFFVDPAYRRQGIATRLWDEASRFLQAAGRTQLFFSSYAPNYIVPGVDATNYPAGDACLRHCGFERLYAPVAMDYSLVSYTYPPELEELQRQREQEGYTIRHADDRDLVELIRFANDVFNPDWGRAIREGIVHGLPLSAIHIVRDPSDRLVGFCMHGGYEGIPERFGPFGVDPSQQGKGLGKLLLNRCLYQMRADGLHNAWFLWTGETTTAGHLYKKNGFSVTRQFHVYRKTLAATANKEQE